VPVNQIAPCGAAEFNRAGYWLSDKMKGPQMSVNLFQAHNQWATRPSDQRFQSLDALAASVNSRRLRSRSVDVDVSKVSAKVENETIVFNRGFQSVEPSHWSFGQMAGWLKAPASYLRTIPTDLAVQCLNHGITAQAKDLGALKFMAITSEDDSLNTLQAVTSTTYGRIWDADVVSAVQRLVERSGGRFHNPLAYAHKGDQPDGFKTLDSSRSVPSGLYASDRDVFMFLIDGGSILEAGPRAKLNRGFFCWNSEVGSRTFGLTTFLFNVVCGNNIVWGAQDINEVIIQHRANGPARFDAEAMPALLNYVNASAQPIESAIRKAQDFMIPRAGGFILPSDISDFANRHGKFTKAEIKSAIDFAKAEEGDCVTLWQLVQGFTAYARGLDWIDARIDLETRAGRLLDTVSGL